MAKKARPLPLVQINVVAEGTVLEGTLYVKEDVRVSWGEISPLEISKNVRKISPSRFQNHHGNRV